MEGLNLFQSILTPLNPSTLLFKQGCGMVLRNAPASNNMHWVDFFFYLLNGLGSSVSPIERHLQRSRRHLRVL
jgi:hypothetical protein